MPVFLAQILSLVRKELLTLLKDPANRIVLFAPAIVQSLLFGYAASFDLDHVPYAVLDQSRGEAATDYLARLDGTGVFERARTLAYTPQIAEVIDEQAAILVIVIPSNFDSELSAGRQAPVQVILDGRNSTTAGMASGYITAVTASFNAAHGGRSPITIERRAWFNPNLESRWQMMTALIAALSMLQTMLIAALSVAREREQGTFDQLLVTPLTPFQILVGKAVPAIVVGLVQSTIILMMALLWFGIPLSGAPWLLYLGLLGFTGASVGIGLSISAVSLNMQQAMLYSFLAIMPLTLLSGLVTPVDNMPEVLQWMTYVNPLRFGVDLVRRVYLEGAGGADVWMNFVPMLGVSAVTLPLAAWMFRRRLA